MYRRYYYDNKTTFDKKFDRYCTTMHSKNCCSMCPECCEECRMEIRNGIMHSSRNISHILYPKDPYNLSTPCTIPQINAADYILGASIDAKLSSTSVYNDTGNSTFWIKHSEYVLLDRLNPSAINSWYSRDEQPVLTVNLANYIKPTAVSYQHAEWNGRIPKGTPRVYDVLACLDYSCQQWEPLAFSCEYYPTEPGLEQKCPVSTNLSVSSINKVQFIFRKNYGLFNQTSVSLIRVYGELSGPPVNEKHVQLKEQRDKATCDSLASYYYSNSSFYETYALTCADMYRKNCCAACPECCTKCEMDMKIKIIVRCLQTLLIVGFACILLIAPLFVMWTQQ